MQPYKFYSNLFSLQGTRNRLSFLGAAFLLYFIIIFLVFTWMVFAPMNMSSIIWSYLLMIGFIFFAQIPIMVQRLRGMLGDNTFYIIITLMLMMIVPILSIILFVWPSKKAA